MSNALSKGKKKRQPLGYSKDELLGIQQYARRESNTNELIGEAHRNVRLIAYQVLHDKFGFGHKRIVRVEQTIDQYLLTVEDESISTEKLEYYMKTKCGISVREEANKVPFRESFALIERKVAPAFMQRAGKYLAATVCNYFSLLGACLKTQFKFSAKQIRAVFEWVRYYINSLSGKYLDMTDIASCLYQECSYCDDRFVGKFREV